MQAAPDPLKLMQSAARTHWRATAWLLERTNPEEYARRPLNSAKAWQIDAALACMMEAALHCVPPERQDEVYDHLRGAYDKAFASLFPHLGNGWNDVKRPKLPPTPLANAQHDRRATVSIQARLRQQQPAEDETADRGILSPKIDVATELPATELTASKTPRTGRFSDQSAPAPSAAPVEAPPNDPHARLATLDQQLRRQAADRRRETILSRKTRAATKRQRAMRKRSRRHSLAH